MAVASAKKIEQISQSADPKAAIIEAVGDTSSVDVLSDLVLVGTFIRNEKTRGGIVLPQEYLKEDEFQGKVGLVLKCGPLAWAEWEPDEERGTNAQIHSWVVFHIMDTWPLQINGVACRLVPYEKLRLRISDPKMVF